MRASEALAALSMGVALLCSCAASRPASPWTAPGDCRPLDAALAVEQLGLPRSPDVLEGVFRARVVAAGRRSISEGALLAEPDGPVRIEFFGPLGLKVHRAVWQADATGLVGQLDWPLEGRSERVVVKDDASARVEAPQPGADAAALGLFSRMLWAFWQGGKPLHPPAPARDGWVQRDPGPARALARRIRFCEDGGFEEHLLLEDGGRSTGFRIRAGAPDAATGYPQHLALEVEGGGPRAEIEIIRQSLRTPIRASPESSAASGSGDS